MRLWMLFTIPLIVFLAGCASYQTSNYQTPTKTQSTATESAHIIEIGPTGFTPDSLNIKVGETVTFVNKDTIPHWPASDIHPTHTVYPEGGGCIGSKFDACKGLAQGEKYSFTFTHPGTWCYHDHLNPSLTGCINVQ